MANSETNGTDETPKPPTLLERLHQEFLARKAPATKQESKKAWEAYMSAHNAKMKAQEAYERAAKVECDATAEVIRLRGRGRFKDPQGNGCTTMGKGENVYIKRDNADDLDSFGG